MFSESDSLGRHRLRSSTLQVKSKLNSLASVLFLLTLSAVANAEVKIGAPFALTGSVAELATKMRSAAELAAKHVNEQGGVLDDTYTLVFADSACDPDKAAAVVKTLIESENVSALVGPICSGATLRQARSVSIPAGVVTLSVASASFLISNLRDDDLVFRTALSDAYKGQAMAEYVIDSGIDTLSVSFASDAYNTGVAKVFTESFVALGGTVVVNQTHQPDKPSYQREVEALAAGSENLVLFAYYGSSGTQLLKDVFALGKIKAVFGSDGLQSQELIDELGEDSLSNTRIINSAADETREPFKIWQGLAENEGITPSGPYIANSYDATFMMALAIEAVQSSSRDSIAQGLRLVSGPEGEVIYPGEFAKARKLLSEGKKINYEGASGVVDFDANGDVSGFISVISVQEGQWSAQLLSSQ